MAYQIYSKTFNGYTQMNEFLSGLDDDDLVPMNINVCSRGIEVYFRTNKTWSKLALEQYQLRYK